MSQPQSILSYLRSHRGEVVETRDLVEHLYHGTKEPEDAANVVRVQIHRLRSEVKIESVHGYRLPK